MILADGAGEPPTTPDYAVPPAAAGDQAQLRVMPISVPGNYVLLDDIVALLGLWANAYEEDKNPSAALALRDAVDALKDIQ